MAPTQDHGLEVLKKTGEEVTPGDHSNYYLKVKAINGATEPVPVTFVPSDDFEVKTIFDEALAVSALSETLVVTYTVPVGKKAYVIFVEFNGTNYGKFRIYIDAVLEGRKDTWIPGPFYDEFRFDAAQNYGLKLTAGQELELTCEHNRPYNGDFHGRIVLVEAAA